ncbi:non-ribosomal peptide synthetase [Dactylosporangium sp. NPDC005572]|uniref:non-ribosomal peptide synthetase n=1 Tax=Dactylosporangium sp. NPDC005572 TaxID=3156889 RepID=UPI0033A20089
MGGRVIFDATTLTELFARQAAIDPLKIAVIDDVRRISYGELAYISERLACELATREPRHLPVGLLVDRSCELVVGMLGILRSGLAYLPLDPSQPDDRIREILADADCVTVVTVGSLRDRVLRLNVNAIRLESMGSPGDPCVNVELPAVTPDALAYVIYTSGSTGVPKGVMVEHRHVLHLLRAMDEIFELSRHDVWTMYHSHAFDVSVWEVWGALAYGASLVVVPYWTSRTPEAMLSLLERERVTVMAQTPSAFQAMIRADMLSRSRAELVLRYVYLAGEKLDFGVLRPWFRARGDIAPQIFNVYGPTETTVYATYRRVTAADLDGSASLIGHGLPGIEVDVLDPNGRQVPDGVEGDLHIGGPSVSRGYLNQTDLTEQRFPMRSGQRWYRTGDLVRRLTGGEIAYLGRLDHQIQVRGFRVELGEIEAKLRTHPFVADCAVAARTEETGSTTLAAYVVAGPAAPTMPWQDQASRFRNHLARQLPDYMVPASFTLLTYLPLNQSGKLDRAALPAPYFPAPLGEQDECTNDVEAALCACWATYLGVAAVAPGDNVFLLGAHSIVAAQVAFSMREQGYQIPLKILLNQPIPREVADWFRASTNSGA